MSKPVSNVKQKNWRSQIVDPISCIKAIFISHNIRELKRQTENPEIHQKIKEMAKECKALALKGYLDKRIAEKYFNYLKNEQDITTDVGRTQ